MMEQQLGDANERHLFHGTQESHLESITRHGFLRDFNAKSAYGKGSYFARDASYSIAERYTPPNGFFSCVMLVTKVLLGESCRGRSNMTIPAEKPNGLGLFESMVDDLDKP
eukprot:TRINITY_DN22924_c0_g1_i4.p2 TRINITY_DN22924_c0_g1~~TRINITY_DN22924_c0_g1_i4.p2  ORF type:complete len:111 (-),score=22.42 TRINITY_DN22924_c0_g1_i4:704-1036(-)